MQIVSQGIDLVECSRIEHILKQHPDRFLARILTSREREYCTRRKDPVPNVAGRFAAKEAILKALGTGWRGSIAWTDMEITNDGLGRPSVVLSGACRELADRLGIEQILISITHTKTNAAASAIAVKK
ncbi:MAG: holo-ACP synthase [Planctomycetota bacterium]|nr:holo-ACP synthase [Planctomycetota bacterium]